MPKEKSGFTVKLKYNFDPSQNLEVLMPTLRDWFRDTAKEFRSFNGERRINGKRFEAKIYSYDTNKTANPDEHAYGKIVNYNFSSKKRQYSAI